MPKSTKLTVAPNTTTTDYLLEGKTDGEYTLLLWGNFDGATVTVKISADGSTDANSLITVKSPYADEAAVFTAPDSVRVPGGVPIYLSMSNTGAGTVYGRLV